ncbi:MAG TPA: Stp1/IreP family PP2C-type Ser/Thr phosphatase [Gammaproteobacteria bacterium]|nr:Stp1/IreP family PP2C-type Ser/Thr phosphatase [Gammaproteobacteria bacterium]
MRLVDSLQFSGHTDPGRVRSHNEDSIHIDAANGLVVLADGMGGYRAGEVASAIAVRSIRDFIVNGLGGLAAGGDGDVGEYSPEAQLVRHAIMHANREIVSAARRETRYEGMGTTVVAMLFHDARVTIGHVGDSRAYRLRGEQLEQLTIDHSLLQELVSRGVYTAEEAQSSPNRNIVTRALGVEREVDVDLLQDMVLPADLYLLCSDGLNDMVGDDEIRLTMNRLGGNLDRMTQGLVAAANERGGRDNISVIAARVAPSFDNHKGLFGRIVDLLP